MSGHRGSRPIRGATRIERLGMVVLLVDDDDGHTMECQLCGARAPFDDGLPYVNQTASYATDHGCPVARAVTTDDAR